MSDGTQTDITFQCRGYPAADASFLRQGDPFLATIHASVERWLQDNVLRTDGVEQSLFHRLHIDTDQFLIEGDRKRRFTTQLRHLRPLVLLDRLFDGVDIVLRQSLQATHRILRGEATIGIHTQFHLLLGKVLADMLDEVEFLEEVDT